MRYATARYAAVAGSSVGGINVSTATVTVQAQNVTVVRNYAIPVTTPNINVQANAVDIQTASGIAVNTSAITTAAQAVTVVRTLDVAVTTPNINTLAHAISLGYDSTIFVGEFPGVNTQLASTVTDPDTINPTINVVVSDPDPSDATWQQFVLGLTGVAGKTLDFEVSLTNKEDTSTINGTWQGPFWAESHAALSWTNIATWNVTAGVLYFSLTVPANVDTIYVASVPPQNRDMTLAYLQQLQTDHPTLVHDDLRARLRVNDGAFVQGRSATARDENNRTVSNLPLYGLRIGNDSLGPQYPDAKPEVVILCGVHAGEWNNQQQMFGFLNRWLTGPDSTYLLTNFNLFVYPLINITGNELGFRRNAAINSASSSFDPNREFNDGNANIPLVAQWQEIFDENHGVFMPNVVAQFDFHDAKQGSNTAYWNYMSGMPNFTNINSIITGINSALDAVVTSVSGTTNELFYTNKSVDFAITCEVADERWTLQQLNDIGRDYCDAFADIAAASLLPTAYGTAFGPFEEFDHETTMAPWVGTGGTLPWTRTNTATPTAGTGPDAAKSGSYFLYTETTGAVSTDTFELLLENIDFSKYIEFQWHFSRHVTSSTLFLDLWDGSSWVNQWSNSTNYVNANWRNEGIDLRSFNNTDGKLRFRVTLTSTSISTNDNGLDWFRLVPKAIGGDINVTTPGISTAAQPVEVLLSVYLAGQSTASTVDSATLHNIATLDGSSIALTADVAAAIGSARLGGLSAARTTDTAAMVRTLSLRSQSAMLTPDAANLIGRLRLAGNSSMSGMDAAVLRGQLVLIGASTAYNGDAADLSGNARLDGLSVMFTGDAADLIAYSNTTWAGFSVMRTNDTANLKLSASLGAHSVMQTDDAVAMLRASVLTGSSLNQPIDQAALRLHLYLAGLSQLTTSDWADLDAGPSASTIDAVESVLFQAGVLMLYQSASNKWHSIFAGEPYAMRNYSKLIDTEGAITYIGLAKPGSATTAAVWQIRRIQDLGGGDSTVLFAGGSDAFNQIWDNRASLSYS